MNMIDKRKVLRGYLHIIGDKKYSHVITINGYSRHQMRDEWKPLYIQQYISPETVRYFTDFLVLKFELFTLNDDLITRVFGFNEDYRMQSIYDERQRKFDLELVLGDLGKWDNL